MEDHEADRLSLGRQGEDAAVRHLLKSGWTILERRFRILRGEIDIIARDRRTVVFIEVKTRRGTGFGPPAASVTESKRRQIRRLAQAYLAGRRLERAECRFDVIGIELPEEGTIRLDHVRDAF